MVNIFRLLVVLTCMALVYMLLSNDAPEFLEKYNLPTAHDVQEMVNTQIEKRTKSPTITMGDDIISRVLRIKNNEVVDNGYLLHDLETEVVFHRFGEYGLEFSIQSLRAVAGLVSDSKTQTVKVDTTGKRDKVTTYDIKHSKKVFATNDWIVVDRGDNTLSYYSEVNKIDTNNVESILLELIMSNNPDDISNPVLAIKLLGCRPPSENDTHVFKFTEERQYAYAKTMFKATRIGTPY